MAPYRITRAATRAVAQPDPTMPAPSGRKRLAGLCAKRNTKPVARKSAAGGPLRNRISGAGAALKEKEVIVIMVLEGEETEQPENEEDDDDDDDNNDDNEEAVMP
ncbi:hypothetical protein S7711_11547 [Stachybotrys chartarum IBT 7711]|uniref:Uncharacterized protein n=1 Tax=Stachybotrys chartarum (strain CBS 109288 / IBT 7711) TaxID=1280523 RepID=A0A084BBC9_STACB|nr:hypothetical protein S7711_11547 [Stachybotrys chartarum IBT 7711]